MTDKMREAFESDHTAALKEICYNEETDRYEANDESDSYALDYAVAMNNEWRVHKRAWQAAQSVPVGEVVAEYGFISDGQGTGTGTYGFWQISNPNLAMGTKLIVQPTHSISAAELERLRKCEAVLVHVRSVLPMDKWADDSRRMIDAAIAAEETDNG